MLPLSIKQLPLERIDWGDKMTTLMDVAKSALALFGDDEPKGPLHVGEVMNLWTYHTMLTEINRFAQMALNTTIDDELIEALNNSIGDCSKQVAEIEIICKKESIPLPPTTEPKPLSHPNDVPLGAKMTDDEIANGLSIKQVLATVACATALTQTIRQDIAALWLNFFLDRIKFQTYFGPVMKERGWLKVPPYYYPPGK